jgi:hypothetical protein
MWETCDIDVWGTTRDLGFPVTRDSDIVKSARDAAEGRQTNFIISPEILRFSRQTLGEWAPGEEPTEYMRTLREMVDQGHQKENTTEPIHSEGNEGTEDQNLTRQMGWCPMQNAWVTSWTGGGKGHADREGHKGRNRSWESTSTPLQWADPDLSSSIYLM